MSNRVLNQAWRVKGLPLAQKLVLVCLADAANGDGHCWPKMETLADETGLHVRTVERATEALADAGHLSRERIGRRNYRYHVHPGGFDPARDRDVNCSRPGAGPGQELNPTRQETGSDPAQDRFSPGRESGRMEPPLNRKRTIGRTRARPIPDDWKPSEFETGSVSAKVVASWSWTERAAQIEQFKAHHASKGSLFVDPQSAWSNWVLNSRKFGVGRSDRPAEPVPMFMRMKAEREREEAWLKANGGRDEQS